MKLTYRRFLERYELNKSSGGYGSQTPRQQLLDAIAQDLRTLEEDALDALPVAQAADVAGISDAQARVVIETFFHGLDPEAEIVFWGRHTTREFMEQKGPEDAILPR